MDRKNKAKQEEEKKRERQKKNEDRSVSTSTQGTYTVPPQNPAPGLGVLTSHWLLLYDLLLQVWPFGRYRLTASQSGRDVTVLEERVR